MNEVEKDRARKLAESLAWNVVPYMFFIQMLAVCIWMFLAHKTPDLGERIAGFLSPVEHFVAGFDPGIRNMFQGKMNQNFYSTFVAEVLVATGIQAIVLSIILITVLIKSPAYFAEKVRGRYKSSALSLSMLLYGLFCLGMSYFMWEITLILLGYHAPSSPVAVNFFKLAFTAGIMTISALATIILAAHFISYLSLVFRSLLKQTR